MEAGQVAIVGSGLIGRAWAVAFARGGHQVALYDAQEGTAAAALERMGPMLQDLAAAGLLEGQAPEAVLARVRLAADLPDAVAAADYVQESSPEVLETKIAVTAEIAAAAGPQTVIASSTSGFVPSAFSEGAPGRERCLVAHPINPPYLLPAVEVVPAPWTDPAMVEKACAVLEAVGQATVVMTREIDGFILNRLQAALMHEAFRLVDQGYVSARDLDRALVGGLAPRWSIIGPFETADLNAPQGIRQYVERYEPLLQRLAATQKETCDMKAVLDKGLEAERRAALPQEAIAERQAWRDRHLMALAAHRKRATSEIGE